MMKKRRRSPVGKKISILRHEGKSKEQSIATALAMQRRHRLTPSGGYIRSKKKSRRRSHK